MPPLLAGFMLVLEGQLTETVYGEEAVSADGKSVQARLGKTRLLSAGDAGTLAYINDSMGLHKVANTTNERTASLHVYAPGWLQPTLFDEIFEVGAGGAVPRLTAAAGETFERHARQLQRTDSS